jgi:hypothetical protein
MLKEKKGRAADTSGTRSGTRRGATVTLRARLGFGFIAGGGGGAISEVATRGRARLGMGFEETGGDVVRARLRLIGFAADDGSDGRARARLGRMM